jgi:hypothetical protein
MGYGNIDLVAYLQSRHVYLMQGGLGNQSITCKMQVQNLVHCKPFTIIL